MDLCYFQSGMPREWEKCNVGAEIEFSRAQNWRTVFLLSVE
jgi:hypothetical protein